MDGTANNTGPATDAAPTSESTAPADAPQGADGAGAPEGGFGGLFPLLLLWVAVIYFFFMRPQKKKEKERRELVNALKKGDKVITIGGIHGTVAKLDDDTVVIKVDEKTGQTLKMTRAAVNTVKGKDKKENEPKEEDRETLPDPQ